MHSALQFAFYKDASPLDRDLPTYAAVTQHVYPTQDVFIRLQQHQKYYIAV